MRRLHRLVLVLAAALASLAGADAHAQMGAIRAMAGGMTAPSINARQIKIYAKILALTAEQTKAAEELLGSYEIESLAAIKRLQEIQLAANQEFMQTGDLAETQGAALDAMRKFNKRREVLERGLLNDLKSLLDPTQLERWPQLERIHRRMTTVNWGSLSGESVDLADLVEGLRLSTEQTSPITPVLSQYEVDLDRVLQARNLLVEEQLRDWFESGFMDFPPERIERMKKQADDLRGAGQKILELNKRYAAQVQPLVPAEQQQEFAHRVKLSSYPTVYRQSYTARVLEAALKFPDLDAGQRDALKILAETYAREAATANDQWAAAITEHELTDDNPLAQLMPGRQLPDTIKQAKLARDAIDQRTIDAAKALLTEQQKAKLPEKKYRPDLDFDARSSGK